MKVLHLISGGDTGGAKTHIISLLKGMDRILDAKIICFIEDTFYHDAKEAGIEIEVYEQKKRSDMSVVKKLADEINREKYDIVHCHGARANFVAMFLKRKINLPMVTTIHSDYRLDFKDNFYKKIVFTTLNTMALKSFKYYIAVSDTFKDMLVDRGFKPDRIFTVYNGIDIHQEVDYVDKGQFLARYNIEDKDQLFVGIIARLDQVKDHESFIRAAKEVLDKKDNIEFLIGGNGPEEDKLKNLCKEYKIQDKVKFLGFVKDPYSMLNAIDINTLTSISESFPYAILEGALMRKPVISTQVGGLKQLIENDVNGYLIKVGDYKDLANRIIYLEENRDKINEFGENLYKKVEKDYSSDSMAETHLEIYKKIIGSWRK